MSVIEPVLSPSGFHTASTLVPTLTSCGLTSPIRWSIPICGDAPSSSITATMIGSFLLLASLLTKLIEKVFTVPVSLTLTHSSVGRKSSSQYIRGGIIILPHLLHFLAQSLP